MNAENACCAEMRALIREGLQGNKGIEWDGSEWCLNGCCGGGCYVLIGISYCPFCGEKTSPPS